MRTVTSTPDGEGGTIETVTYAIYFVAAYTPNNYNVIYKVDGVQTDSESVTFNSSFTVKAEPTKTGYTFDGWYEENEPTVKVNAGTQVTLTQEGATYNGTFNPNTYTVTFDANGGSYASGNGDVSVVYDTQITEPAVLPTKTGYALKGWATSASATVPEYRTGADTTYAELPVLTSALFGTQLYAVWEASEANYTIEFYYQNITDDGYTIDSTKTIENDPDYTALVGSTVSVSAADIADNAENGFEYRADNVNNVLSGVIPETGTLVLKVYYSRLSYVLKTDVAGTVTVIGTYKYGADLSGVTIADPVVEGTYFTGWTPEKPATMPANDVTLVAVLPAENYNIAYNINGGSGVTPTGETVTYGQSYTLAGSSAFSKNGYDFDGWYLGTDGNNLTTKMGDAGEALTIADLGSNGDTITLYAKWTIASYTLSFDSDGGSEVGSQTVEYNALAIEPAAPTKAGYTFQYWTYNDEQVDFSTFRMPYFNVQMVAVWTPNQYTISFEENGGSVVADVTAAYQSSVAEPTAPTKEGYTFGGWYTSNDNMIDATRVTWPVAMPLNGATYYAKWDINQYTITFDSNGGTPVSAITQDYATPVTAPAAPTKEGYEFAGWQPSVPTTMPAEDITLVAQWTVLQYTITYVLDNGSANIEQTYDFGGAVTAPENPSKAGYTFTGWDITIPATMPAQDLTATAQWQIHEYSLVFDVNGGANIDITTPVTVNYNDAVTLPVFNTDFTNTGYSFSGWYYDGAAVSGATFTVPALASSGDTLTLTAQYTQNTYHIYYKEADGTLIDTSADLHYNDSIAALEITPVKTGYDFADWYSDAALTTVFTDWTFMPADDITVYAKWNRHEYSAVFYEPDSVNGEPTFDNSNIYATIAPITIGDTLGAADVQDQLSAYPAVNNYDFLGWTLDPSAEEVEIIAADEITAWTLTTEFAEDLANDEIDFYPVYERTEVTLELVSTSQAAIVDKDETVTPSVGFIYNVGDRQKLASVTDQLEVQGDGTLQIFPSKGQYCGTGTKVTVTDNVTNTIVETYYLVVFGDVDGSANCTALDYSMVVDEIAKEDAYRTWGIAEDGVAISELTAEEQLLCECYFRAADVDGNDELNAYDAGDLELYVLKIYPYEFIDQRERYSVVTD